jgi:DNA polymerase-3 subunit delta'
MQFHSIIGQKEVKQQLVELIQHNRLSHALLFLGKEGNGSLQLAMALAQYITCEKSAMSNGQWANKPSSLFEEEPPTTNYKPPTFYDSCGTCSSCIKARQFIHPDIHFSYPVVTKKPGSPPISTDYISEWREFIKSYPYGNVYDWLQFIGAENKQGNITAQECNDIIRQLNLKSFESEYKILIMWMPEYLGNEGNKLLKLIEEPPPNTLFILVAENESLILPTIVSRCQLIKIPALEIKDVEEALINGNNIPIAIGAETARQAASVSEGNFRDALQLVQHAEEDWQNLLREWLNAVLKTGPVAQTKWVEDISRLGREKQKQFLRYFNHQLEQAIRHKLMGENIYLSANEKDFANRLNRIADIAQQQAIIRELDNATYHSGQNCIFDQLRLRAKEKRGESEYESLAYKLFNF